MRKRGNVARRTPAPPASRRVRHSHPRDHRRADVLHGGRCRAVWPTTHGRRAPCGSSSRRRRRPARPHRALHQRTVVARAGRAGGGRQPRRWRAASSASTRRRNRRPTATRCWSARSSTHVLAPHSGVGRHLRRDPRFRAGRQPVPLGQGAVGQRGGARDHRERMDRRRERAPGQAQFRERRRGLVEPRRHGSFQRRPGCASCTFLTTGPAHRHRTAVACGRRARMIVSVGRPGLDLSRRWRHRNSPLVEDASAGIPGGRLLLGLPIALEGLAAGRREAGADAHCSAPVRLGLEAVVDGGQRGASQVPRSRLEAVAWAERPGAGGSAAGAPGAYAATLRHDDRRGGETMRRRQLESQ